MKNNKKAQADSFNTIKNAILVLLVLVVVAGVFYVLMKEPIKRLFQLGEEPGNQDDQASEQLSNIFGGCDSEKDTEERCSLGNVVKCENNRWVVVDGKCDE